MAETKIDLTFSTEQMEKIISLIEGLSGEINQLRARVELLEQPRRIDPDGNVILRDTPPAAICPRCKQAPHTEIADFDKCQQGMFQ